MSSSFISTFPSSHVSTFSSAKNWADAGESLNICRLGESRTHGAPVCECSYCKPYEYAVFVKSWVRSFEEMLKTFWAHSSKIQCSCKRFLWVRNSMWPPIWCVQRVAVSVWHNTQRHPWWRSYSDWKSLLCITFCDNPTSLLSGCHSK